MPAGKRQTTNTALYTLVTFVVLFLITTVVAVIFYIRSEDYQQQADTYYEQRQEVVNNEQWTNRGTIVGAKERTETYLGTMVGYLDDMTALILGGLPEQGSAEAKVAEVNAKFENTFDILSRENNIRSADPNMEGLIWIIEELKTKLDSTTESERNLSNRLADLQTRFDDAIAASYEKEQTLLAEKEKYRQQVEEIRTNYEGLQALMKQSTEEQVQMLVAQLEQYQANNKELNQNLMKTEAELRLSRQRMELAQNKLQAVVPPPDNKVAAYKTDGKILLIDDQSKIVHLDIGSKDQVYRGLTFSVYDKHAPIPKDGKGKAEVEVYNVGENISAARIINSNIKNPIIVNDVVINLIWDAEQTNVFVVAGEFDLDGNGKVDLDGPEKVKLLINKWGGAVAENVSVETDYVVLGDEPTLLTEPTFEQMGIDPLAMDKYEESVQRHSRYQDVRSQADSLSIPVFNPERFLYLIGYKSQAGRPGAFN